jgi:prepilin-type N-terminal cleavage/methylation domain-containing protein
MLEKIKNTGFTLVELLVVIAIIGILSTATVVNLRGAKDKALDSQIFGTLAQLRSAVVGCMYEDQELKCSTDGGDPCAGNAAPAPVAGQKICDGTNTTWLPLTNRPDMTWYKAKSNTSNGTFCFEMEQQINAYSVPLYYTCTEKNCERRFSTLCSEDCQIEGEWCLNDSDCCGDLPIGNALICAAGYCIEDTNVVPTE